MKKQTTITAVTLKTDLHLEVANDSFRRATHMLSPIARKFIARRLREHAKQILKKADVIDGPRDGVHWIFQDNSIRFIAANGEDISVLDECHSEISHLAIPGTHYIRYKEAFKSKDEDDREVPLFQAPSSAAETQHSASDSTSAVELVGSSDGSDSSGPSSSPAQTWLPLNVIAAASQCSSSTGEFVNDTQGQHERVR